jgi:hypothetical protein
MVAAMTLEAGVDLLVEHELHVAVPGRSHTRR